MKKLRLAIAASAAAVALAGTSGVAFGADPFLCPAVGDGVQNAAAHGGNVGGGSPILDIASGTSFLPGNNQAGANSNPNGHNTLGPGESPGPGGGNSDWSPIWPGS